MSEDGGRGDFSGILFAGAAEEPAGNDRFSEFWSMYPRRVARKEAERAWKRAAVSSARAGEILYGLERHLPSLLARELQFRPHAATWLRQERWRDEPEPIPATRSARELLDD